MKIKELHLKAGYPSIFSSIPEAKIENLPLQGECTDVFLITLDDDIANKCYEEGINRNYLLEGISSFEWGVDD